MKPILHKISGLALMLACALPSWGQKPTEGDVIDMGLSVNWCSTNVGASAPELIGNLYPYAYIITGSVSQSMYKFVNQDNGNFDLPESISGNVAYDAAAKTSEGRWRMATKAQWEELIANCDIEYGVTYNNVRGSMLTSKINGNSLFLPGGNYSAMVNGCISYYTSEAATSGTIGYMPYYASFSTYSNANSVLQMQYSRTSKTGPWTALPIRAVCDRYDGPKLQNITLTADKTEIFAGMYSTITAVNTPGSVPATTKFSTSDESLATIDDKGCLWAVYGTKGGTVTVTAEQDGITATIDIKITAVETPAHLPVVDMGLSVDWYPSNIGAENDEDAGIQVPFAYTKPLEEGEEYRYYHSYPYPGYYELPSDDIAGNVAYDGVASRDTLKKGARMARMSEYQELIDNCDAHFIAKTNDPYDGGYMLFVSRLNGHAVKFPMTSPSSSYHASTTNTEKTQSTKFIVRYQTEKTLAVVEYNEYPNKKHYLRGVRPHRTKPYVTDIQLSQTEASIYEQTILTLRATPMPDNAVFENCTWSSNDETIATVDANGKVKALAPGSVTISATDLDVTASAQFTIKPLDLSTDERVDMGTRVSWASCEIGAKTPYDKGAYYLWGMTEPYPTSSASQNDWVAPSYSKIAYSRYDVAAMTMDFGWHMPTMDDLLELAENIDYEHLVLDGHNGALLTSKTTGARLLCRFKPGATIGFYTGDEMKYDEASNKYTIDVLVFHRGGVARSSINPWNVNSIRPVCDPIQTGVDNVETAPVAIEAVYTLDGCKVGTSTDSLTPGIYVIRFTNGRVRKIII